jgi:hypothetical protein
VPERPEREALRSKAAYLGAARRVLAAIRTLAELDVVLLDDRAEVPTWTAEQMQAVRTCANAWTELEASRRDFDAVSKYLRTPESWPHA